jgi:hypothetical protein
VNLALGLGIVRSFACPATLVFGLDAYSLQEAILVLLLVAFGVIVVLLILVALVLFREGVRLGLAWLKARVAHTTSMSGHRIGSGEPIGEPRLLK